MNSYYTPALAKQDSARSLSGYKSRQFFSSWKASVIVFIAMPFYMLLNLSKGKQMTILAGIAMSVMSLTSIYA